MLFEPPAPPCPPIRPPSRLIAKVVAFTESADGAFSKNTERALKSDLGIFVAWCNARGRRDLPAAPETISRFVDDMAASRAPATVRRYVTSIGVAHRVIGYPTRINDPLVKLALQRMHRRQGRRQAQAGALTWPLRQRLLEAAGDRLIDDRNRALVAVAYDAMMRRSELVSCKLGDLVEEARGAGTMLVRRSKTDVEGCGDTVYLAPDTMRLVATWVNRSRLVEGRLFRSVRRCGQIGERLHPSQIPRIFKDMAIKAGIAPEIAEQFSGHSARVGAAQDMIAAGIELPAIMQAGRWKTTAMVSRYGERLLAQRSGAAQLAQFQRRS